MTREKIIDFYVAWGDGSMTDDYYCDRAECLEWLNEFKDVEPDLAEMDEEELKDLAEELCRMYEEDMEEEEK